MSESQQRLICRLAFVIVCLLPTMFVVWTIFSPGRTARWESRFQDGLGLNAKIESVTTPLPGIIELHQVSLSDFQAGHLLDLADIKLADTPQGTRCIVSELTINAEELGLFLQRINSLLEKKTECKKFRVRFDRINVVHENADTKRILSQKLEDCVLDCQETATEKKILLDFKLSAATANDCQLAIIVDQTKDKSQVKWIFKTKGAAVPCWIVSGWIEQMALLGDDCTFSGEATGGYLAGKPFAQVKGTFVNLDLSRLVQQSFPHELTGLATIEVDKCLITEQGIVKANGKFSTQQEGLIGPTLLAAAKQYLSMRTPQDLPIGTVSYGMIEFEFETRSKTEIREDVETRVMEIAIRGDKSGTLILDSYGIPMLSQSGLEYLPIGNLLQTLLPNGQQQALANPQCRQVLALFPSDSHIR